MKFSVLILVCICTFAMSSCLNYSQQFSYSSNEISHSSNSDELSQKIVVEICSNDSVKQSSSQTIANSNDNARPEWFGKQFQLNGSEEESINTFVEWTKKNGEIEVYGRRLEVYEWNKTYLEATKNKNTLLIPKTLSENFQFSGLTTSVYDDSYVFSYENNDNYFDVKMQIDFSGELTKYVYDYCEENGIDKSMVQKGSCKYGEILYINHIEDESGTTQIFSHAYLRYKDYLLTLVVFSRNEEPSDFNADMFNWFKLEETSLI